MENFEIQKTIIAFPAKDSGWHKELNLISWFGKAPVYDLRDWNADHTKMSKGITLTKDELMILKEAEL